jgi:hypothetical protein
MIFSLVKWILSFYLIVLYVWCIGVLVCFFFCQYMYYVVHCTLYSAVYVRSFLINFRYIFRVQGRKFKTLTVSITYHLKEPLFFNQPQCYYILLNFHFLFVEKIQVFIVCKKCFPFPTNYS